MNEAHQLLQKELKLKNLSITKARLAIFSCLFNKDAQTMSQITKSCSTFDRATIYRTIATFEKIKIIHRVNIGWKFKYELSDKFVKHHHHLYCIGCGKTILIEDNKQIETIIRDISKSFNFNHVNHQFDIQGFCEDCNEK